MLTAIVTLSPSLSSVYFFSFTLCPFFLSSSPHLCRLVFECVQPAGPHWKVREQQSAVFFFSIFLAFAAAHFNESDGVPFKFAWTEKRSLLGCVGFRLAGELPLSTLMPFCFLQSGWAKVVCGVGSLIWIRHQRTQFIRICKLRLFMSFYQCLSLYVPANIKQKLWGFFYIRYSPSF